MEDGVKNTDELAALLRQFENAADSSVDHRLEGELARDYYDGDQYTRAERQALEKRKQPIVTDNRTADKIQYMLGMERKSRTDPKAYPRNPTDEGAAEAATDGIRYVFDCNDFPQVKSAVWEHMLIEGVGAAEVIRDGDKDKIRKIRWDRLYWDPHSMELDFSDATYLGIVTWMDAERAKKRWPDKEKIVDDLMAETQRTTSSDTFEDKPIKRFVDLKRKRVQVFEHCYWDGKWKRAAFCQGGFFEDPADSPYKDEDGEPEAWIIAQCAFRDREGKPYGLVRRYKDIQDEVNKRRSKALHLLSTRFTKAEKGAVGDVEKARREVHKPDGYVEVTPGMMFEVESNTEMGMSQFQLLQDAIQAFNMTGPNAALQGQSGQISGRAKQLDQEGGAIQIGPLFDQIRFFQKRVARAVWNRMKQFWNEETWVRVTDDEQKLKFVGFNVPVTAGEQALTEAKQRGATPEQLQAMVAHAAQDPFSQQVMSKKNEPARMHMDIIIEEAPDTVTIQQEQFQSLIDLAPAGVVFPPEVYIEASQLRNKRRLIEMVKSGGEQTPEAQQTQQVQQQLMQAGAEAEVRKTVAEADLSEAQVDKTKVETAVLMTEAVKPDLDPPPKPVAPPAAAAAKKKTAAKK